MRSNNNLATTRAKLYNVAMISIGKKATTPVARVFITQISCKYYVSG